MNRKLCLVEIGIGIISMILGAWISALVFRDGYFVGALMLVVTGALSVLLGIREYKKIKGPAWQETFLKILRRTMLFLNAMLSAVIAGTLVSMFGG